MTISTETSLEGLYNEIVSQADFEMVLSKLGLEPNNKGEYSEIICPQCNQKEAFFYPNLDTKKPRITCNRKNKCGYDAHILKHLNNGSFPEGSDWKEKVEELAKLAGLPFDIKNYSDQKPKKKSILQSYWEFLKERFPGSSAEKYIIETRKLDPSITEYGYFPSTIEEVNEWAQREGFSHQELLNAGIIKKGNNNPFVSMYERLAGAFIDQSGKVHNIWGRDTTGKMKGSQKYLNLDNSDFAHKKSPYGANWIKDNVVVWVEGYLDAIALRECGIPAVASGTASIPEDMVNSLKGIDTIIIALDQDGAGGKGAFRFIEKNINNENLKIFTINHELMNGCKDVAELYQKEGFQAVKNIFLESNLDHAFTFAAKYIPNKNKGDSEWTATSKEKAISEAIKFDKSISNPSKRILLKEYFWEKGIEPKLRISSKDLDDLQKDLIRKQEEKKYNKKIEQISKEAHELSKNGNIEAAAKTLSQIHSIYNPQSKKTTQKPIQFINAIDKNWLDKEPPKKEMLLSYFNNSQNSVGFLPKSIVGMVAGPGGVGKSHLMTQIAVSIASKNPLFGEYTPNKPGAVFLGMGENSIEDIQRLIYKHTKDLPELLKSDIKKNLAPYSLHGTNATFIENGNPSSFFYYIKEELIKNAPEEGWSLLIFDPVSRLLGVDAEKDNALATIFISLLESLTKEIPGNPTVLFAHHVNKASINQKENQNQSAARGASALTDGCRWQMNFFKSEKEDGIYNLTLPKTNFTAPIDPIVLEKGYNGELKELKKRVVR